MLRVGGMDEYEEMLAGGGGGFFGNMFDGLFKEVREEQAESDGEVVSIEDEYNPDKDPDCIHIFSLASGHAYERFQKIMFQSLLEHTNSKVKFWLLDNFASPQFKDFVPVMAKEYGFYYEFVSYNWPHWLRRQTQKQRVMWGYKILFLDVLFPLDVKRVIFVDADQILRADVKELWEMDLGEAPYGYTPMCMSNKEMEGFMFWNQGFWCAPQPRSLVETKRPRLRRISWLVSGWSICKGDRTTSPRSTSSTCSASARRAWATGCAPPTTSCRGTPTRSPTSTRICPTTRSTRSRSSRCRRSGCGARRGARWRASRTRRRSTCATTRRRRHRR